jgi:acetoin utilization deacetylase AcuC-like enzyme
LATKHRLRIFQMKLLFNNKFLEHNIDSESEGAYRIKDFQDHCELASLNGEEYITLVHSEAYRKMIMQACMDCDYVAEVELTPVSYEAACLSVGLTVLASQQGDFAVVRPPGHHAGREQAAGFCFFNNIAIATQKLVNEGKRVLIFDIDGHHGNGTQSIFYYSNKVMYCSIHQHYAYPFSGFPEQRGEGEGFGYTFNFPLLSGSGDKEFLQAVDKAIQVGKNFKPDVVAVSAGFDGYEKDRLLQLNCTLRGYYECGFRLRRAFKNIFAVLEGGYHYDLKKCVDHFVDGIHKGALPSSLNWDTELSIG